jgi:Uncharacterized protein conserved in bacteria
LINDNEQAGMEAGVQPNIQANEQPTLNEMRWVYMDVCKIVAFVFIVFTNIVAGVWGSVEIGSSAWSILTAYNGLARFSVPLFFLILGALLINPLKELTIKEIYLKYLVPVLTAFIFWSAAYVLFTNAIYSPEVFDNFNVQEFVTKVLIGDPYRHWFVFLIIQFYLVLPFLRAIAKSMDLCKCFLVLWIIFSLLITTLTRLPAVIAMPDMANTVISEGLGFLYRIRPVMVIDYMGFAVLGYYIHNINISRKIGKLAIFTFIASTVYTILMTNYMSVRMWAPDQIFFENISFNTCIAAASFMIIMKVFSEGVWYKTRTYNSIIFFSTNAFGIFMIHAFVLNLLTVLDINGLTFGPVLSTPILCIIVTLVSVLVSFCIKKVPKVGDYLV